MKKKAGAFLVHSPPYFPTGTILMMIKLSRTSGIQIIEIAGRRKDILLLIIHLGNERINRKLCCMNLSRCRQTLRRTLVSLLVCPISLLSCDFVGPLPVLNYFSQTV